MESPLFIAEVSSNHHQNLERCLKFIDVAAKIKCGAVKFQLFKINELFAPEVLAKKPELKKRKVWQLPVSFLPTIANKCHENGLQFSCTPFYLKAVEELFPYVDFYKIASYELLWKDLLIACAKTGKPVILSTGMATMHEVKNSFKILVESGCKQVSLLHCVSSYPVPVRDCNLSIIDMFRKQLGSQFSDISFKVGWSDHTVNPGVIYRAVFKWESQIVEFHLDIDGKGAEYTAGHCWLPEQIAPVIHQIENGFLADGSNKKVPAKSELSDRDWRADPSDGLRPLLKTRMVFK